MTWATVADVLAYTGKEVSEEDVTMASGVIDLYAGTDPEQPEDSIAGRDRRWLKMATAYQTPWQMKKPGYFEHRESHESASADSVSRKVRSDSEITLAPLAARALRNLSWIGLRSTRFSQGAGVPKGSFLHEAGDEWHGWTPRPIA